MHATLPRRPRQRKRVARFCKLTHAADRSVLTLRVGKKTSRYVCGPILCQLGGKGVEVRKSDGSSYHVRLDGTDSTCDCLGFEAHGRCKHVDSLLALDRAGKL